VGCFEFGIWDLFGSIGIIGIWDFSSSGTLGNLKPVACSLQPYLYTKELMPNFSFDIAFESSPFIKIK
jgi:hypothetical protein